jgi:MtaA/CmuA family methyltransferase
MEHQRRKLWMSPKRRILSGVFGGRVDRPPVGSPTSTVTVETMQKVGAFFPEAHLDAEKMTRLAAAGHEITGFDCVMPVFSVIQEAAALGCEINWGAVDTMPAVRKPIWSSADDVKIPTDFLKHPAIACVLQSVSALRRQYNDRVAVIGKALGPWTLAYDVFGVSEFLIKTILDPDDVKRIVERLTPLTVLFAKAQFEAGADVLCIPDHVTGNLVSAKTYTEFLLPAHQQLTQEIQGPLVLHCCGNTTDRLEYFVAAGWDCYHFESQVDARDARRIVGRRMSLWGNVNNPSTLFLGTPEEVRKETVDAWEAGVDILGPECAVPLATRDANLIAIAEAAQALGPRES